MLAGRQANGQGVQLAGEEEAGPHCKQPQQQAAAAAGPPLGNTARLQGKCLGPLLWRTGVAQQLEKFACGASWAQPWCDVVHPVLLVWAEHVKLRDGHVPSKAANLRSLGYGPAQRRSQPYLTMRGRMRHKGWGAGSHPCHCHCPEEPLERVAVQVLDNSDLLIAHVLRRGQEVPMQAASAVTSAT